MNWRETIAKTASYLAKHEVPEAQVASELLAARLLKIGRGFLAAQLERESSPMQLEALRRAMARLVKGEPLQYVLGEWDFRALTLKCDKRALIPRPETEELVSRVLEWLRKTRPSRGEVPPLVVDVGTGTGAIVLALASEFSEAVYLGTDVSEAAIALARENAERLRLADRVKLAVADGLDDFDEPECLDVIVSNPPYIASRDCETLEPRVRDYEPRLALDGGNRGLDFYERYLSDALHLLKSRGAVFFEIGSEQGADLEKLMNDYGFANIRIEKDFSGHDRYASAELP